MMEYVMFKKIVEEKFMDFLPEEYRGSELRISTIDKVNRTLDALSIVTDEPGTHISPTIYVNHMYEEYVNTEDLNGTIMKAAMGFEEAMKKRNDFNVDMLHDPKYAKENIVFELVNTMQNQRMLEDMPHREFRDLSIIYRLVIKVDAEGMVSAPVKNIYAKQLGFNEEQLFAMAAVNTKQLLPPVVKSMNDVMREIFQKDGIPNEVIEVMMGNLPPEQQMYVISNKNGLNGAASMLYEDGLHELAERIGSDLYILPSSKHEVIAISAEMGEPQELAAMVAEINRNEVKLEERLSNQVYHYDKELRKVTVATDTPNKSLDGIVAEAPMIYNADKSR